MPPIRRSAVLPFFDPKMVECPGADAPICLTAPQVGALNKIYGPATNLRKKEAIFPGLEPGSELGWRLIAGGKASRWPKKSITTPSPPTIPT